MKNSLMVVDGVLRKLVGASPIGPGMRLYHSLARTGRLILVARDDRDQVEDWLELHGCVNHDFILWSDGRSTADVANGVRRDGYDVDIVVEPDPGQARELIYYGFNTLVFTHSQFAHPSWRPDSAKGVEEWATIELAVAREAKMKAADERLRSAD